MKQSKQGEIYVDALGNSIVPDIKCEGGFLVTTSMFGIQ